VEGGRGRPRLVREAEWPEYRGLYASTVRDLPNAPEYGRLKAWWKRLTSATLAEDVLQILRDIEGLAAPNEFEPGFFYRMQWLPYVGQAAKAETRVNAALEAELGGLAVAKAREWTDRQGDEARVELALEVAWLRDGAVTGPGGGRRRVHEERRRLGLRQGARPLRRGRCPRVVADTKWKRLDPRKADLGVSGEDVYQVLAYAHRYATDTAVLIYPHHAAVGRAGFQRDFVIQGAGAAPVVVLVITVDLARLESVAGQMGEAVGEAPAPYGSRGEARPRSLRGIVSTPTESPPLRRRRNGERPSA